MLRNPYTALPNSEQPPGRPSRRICSCGRAIRRCWGRFIIDPSNNAARRFVDLWESQMVVLLVITAVLTPYEIAYTTPGEVWASVFFDRICDVSFGLNIIFMFLLAYPDPLRPARFVKEPTSVAWHYLTGWFVIDVIAWIPVEVYWVVLTEIHTCMYNTKESVNFEMIHLLRTLRLLRLARFSALFERWTTNFGWSFAELTLLKFFVGTILCCHWMACVWGGLAFFLQRSDEMNWLDALHAAKGGKESLYENPAHVYCMSLYWAIVTLTSIGYGDIVPQSHTEYVFACFGMVVMAAFWAYVIGSVCSIVSTLQPHELEYQRAMDNLNLMLRDRKMPQEMRSQFRRYFMEARERSKQTIEQSVIDHMSPMLQGECAMFMHKEALEQIWYFKELDKEAVVGAARHLKLLLFAPTEDILGERALFIIRRGICSQRGRLLTHGETWGEDMILENEFLRHTDNAKAMSYLSVLRLRVEHLDDVIYSFPKAKEWLRVAQVRIALTRGFIKLGQALKQLKDKFNLDIWSHSEGIRSELYGYILAGMLPPVSDMTEEHFNDLLDTCRAEDEASLRFTDQRSRATTGQPKHRDLDFAGSFQRNSRPPGRSIFPQFTGGGSKARSQSQGPIGPSTHVMLQTMLDSIQELKDNIKHVEAKVDSFVSEMAQANPRDRNMETRRSQMSVASSSSMLAKPFQRKGFEASAASPRRRRWFQKSNRAQ